MVTTTTTDEPFGATPEPPRRRRGLILGAAAAVAVLVGLGAWAVVGRDDGKPSGTIPNASDSGGTVPAAAAGTTDLEATQLLALLEKGRAATFHATYVASGDPQTLGGDLTIEVWRHSGRIRQDTVVSAASGTSHTAGFVVDGQAATCVETDDQPWTCSSASSATADVDGIFGSAATQLQGVDVTVADDTVNGHTAKCFTFPASDGTGTLCVTEDGIPVKLAINGENLTVKELSTSVDDHVFSPPAPVTAATSS